jgi:NAD(P)-dependent dehydrogenase (short-subunit alcohol dehydrogenase family)
MPGAIGLHLDVTRAASYPAFLTEVTDRLGALDILVANAAVMWVGAFADEPESSIARQFAVHVQGVIRGFRLTTRRPPVTRPTPLPSMRSAATAAPPARSLVAAASPSAS